MSRSDSLKHKSSFLFSFPVESYSRIGVKGSFFTGQYTGQRSLLLLEEHAVELPLAEPGADALDLGDVVAELLLGLDLLAEELALDEVAKLGVSVLLGDLGQVQQGLLEDGSNDWNLNARWKAPME